MIEMIKLPNGTYVNLVNVTKIKKDIEIDGIIYVYFIGNGFETLDGINAEYLIDFIAKRITP